MNVKKTKVMVFSKNCNSECVVTKVWKELMHFNFGENQSDGQYFKFKSLKQVR